MPVRREVLVSSTVRELVLGSGIEFVERGTYTLKGVPDEWHLFAFTGDGRTDARPVSEVSAGGRRSHARADGDPASPRPSHAGRRRIGRPALMRTLGRPILHRKRPRSKT